MPLLEEVSEGRRPLKSASVDGWKGSPLPGAPKGEAERTLWCFTVTLDL